VKYFFSLCFFFYTAVSWCQAGVRVICSENDAWQFTKEWYQIGDSLKSSGVQWQNVLLPHTWNADDVMDDVPGYFRGICWYRKKIAVSNHLKHKQVFLYFEGANQETEIFINGKKAGEHTGGYTAFCIPISKYLSYDEKDNLN
jgi:beta-galactosidase